MDNFSEAVAHELETQGIALKLVLPGFVLGINFVAQTQAAARNIPVPTGYQDYLNERMAAYASTDPVALAADEDVANTILAAATDESGRLRWLVGPDVAECAHYRWETSEADNAAWTRARFAPAR